MQSTHTGTVFQNVQSSIRFQTVMYQFQTLMPSTVCVWARHHVMFLQNPSTYLHVEQITTTLKLNISAFQVNL